MGFLPKGVLKISVKNFNENGFIFGISFLDLFCKQFNKNYMVQ